LTALERGRDHIGVTTTVLSTTRSAGLGNCHDAVYTALALGCGHTTSNRAAWTILSYPSSPPALRISAGTTKRGTLRIWI
jgi:hypothetical protein